MAKLIIKGSRLVTEEGIKPADLLVENGRIKQISETVKDPDARVIDASGKYTLPGVIDPHVHFELEAYGSHSADDFRSGTRSAAAGGVTTVIDFAIPRKGQTMAERVKEKKLSAEKKAVVDYSFHAQINGWGDDTAGQMEETINTGVTTFKIFMPRTEGWGVDDYGLFNALKKSAELGSLIMLHAENGGMAQKFREELEKENRTSVKDYPESRPAVIEREAVLRAAALAEETKAPVYFCHISAASSALEIKRLKRRGQDVFMETCPQYLVLNSGELKKRKGFLYMCCPPLRTLEDNYGLWRNILEDTVDTVGTDHCPFTVKEKKKGEGDFRKTPMGLPGVENLLPIMFTEGVLKRKIKLEQLAAVLSTRPAKVFGLYPQKGTIREGSDADMVIFDPDKKKTIRAGKLHSKCGWSPYEGFKSKGCPEYTISRGEIIYERGQIKAIEGRGKFLRRKLFQPRQYYS